jgi:hypothetical protein
MALVGELETELAASRAIAANLLSALITELTTKWRPVPELPDRAAPSRVCS